MAYRVEARMSGKVPASSLCVLYGKEWEVCEGAVDLTHEEAQEVMMSFLKDDRLTARECGFGRTHNNPHEYQIVETVRRRRFVSPL